jgi:hypothetical protein
MRIIDSFPRLKARLLRLLRDDIAWREKDLDRYRQIKAELEKI